METGHLREILRDTADHSSDQRSLQVSDGTEVEALIFEHLQRKQMTLLESCQERHLPWLNTGVRRGGGGHVCETVWTSSEGALERFKTDKGVYLWRPPKTSGKNKNTDFIHGAREVPLLKYKPTNFLLQVAQDWVSMSPPIIASLW